jgi:hypothetical protein
MVTTPSMARMTKDKTPESTPAMTRMMICWITGRLLGKSIVDYWLAETPASPMSTDPRPDNPSPSLALSVWLSSKRA